MQFLWMKRSDFFKKFSMMLAIYYFYRIINLNKIEFDELN